VISLGTTSLPLAGWLANPQRPEESRAHRLHAIRQIVGHYGLQAVELTLDLHAIYPHVFDARFYDSVADLQQELGFVCTAHLPFLWIELGSLNETVRRASVDCLRQAMEVTRAVDVHTYVLHLMGFTTAQIVSQAREPAQRQALVGALMGQAGRSLEVLCEIVDPADLCVENLEDALFDLALPVLDQLGASICFDVGHLALQGSSQLHFLKRHAGRIREIHLHDATVPPFDEEHPARDHLALGQGQIDHATLLQELGDSGYNGPVILEVNTEADLQQSLERLRAIL